MQAAFLHVIVYRYVCVLLLSLQGLSGSALRRVRRFEARVLEPSCGLHPIPFTLNYG